MSSCRKDDDIVLEDYQKKERSPATPNPQSPPPASSPSGGPPPAPPPPPLPMGLARTLPSSSRQSPAAFKSSTLPSFAPPPAPPIPPLNTSKLAKNKPVIKSPPLAEQMYDTSDGPVVNGNGSQTIINPTDVEDIYDYGLEVSTEHLLIGDYIRMNSAGRQIEVGGYTEIDMQDFPCDDDSVESGEVLDEYVDMSTSNIHLQPVQFSDSNELYI